MNMTARPHQTPSPKVPRHPITAKPARALDDKIDRQMEDTFPASDPPSYSGGKHAIGAPENRESESPTAGSRAVREAEKQVKDGKVAPDKY
jgi:hypothetical protein